MWYVLMLLIHSNLKSCIIFVHIYMHERTRARVVVGRFELCMIQAPCNNSCKDSHGNFNQIIVHDTGLCENKIAVNSEIERFYVQE